MSGERQGAERDVVRQDLWNSLTAEEKRGIEKVVADLDDPEFFTADELRELADAMDWLAEGPLRVAMVEVGGERPWAWIHKHPHNGPTVQVAFQRPPTDKEYREGLTRPIPPGSDEVAR